VSLLRYDYPLKAIGYWPDKQGFDWFQMVPLADVFNSIIAEYHISRPSQAYNAGDMAHTAVLAIGFQRKPATLSIIGNWL
jgi:hypothetical protein